MITAWLIREGRWAPAFQLRRFSEYLAADLYIHAKERGQEMVESNQIKPLAERFNIPVADLVLRARTLLNRYADGHYKFAHRSMMEYCCVRAFITDPERLANTKWTHQMKIFLLEILCDEWHKQKINNIDLSRADLDWPTARKENVFKFGKGGRDLRTDAVRRILKAGYWDSEFNKEAVGFPHSFRSYNARFVNVEYQRQVLLEDSSWRSAEDLQNTVLHAYLSSGQAQAAWDLSVVGGVFYCTLAISQVTQPEVLIDHVTGLKWQPMSFGSAVPYYAAELYIYTLNALGFSGSNDWRLPSLEEAISLVQPHGGLFSGFPKHLDSVWTSDYTGDDEAWCINVELGHCERKKLLRAKELSMRKEFCCGVLAVR